MDKYQRFLGYQPPQFREPPRMSYEWAGPADRIADYVNPDGTLKKPLPVTGAFERYEGSADAIREALESNEPPAQAISPEGHSSPVETIQEPLDSEGGQVRDREPLPDPQEGG